MIITSSINFPSVLQAAGSSSCPGTAFYDYAIYILIVQLPIYMRGILLLGHHLILTFAGGCYAWGPAVLEDGTSA